MASTRETLDKDISEEEVLEAIKQGKPGRAPGMTGYTKEFYRFFSEDLIGHIMKYISYTEQTGILSDNLRLKCLSDHFDSYSKGYRF